MFHHRRTHSSKNDNLSSSTDLETNSNSSVDSSEQHQQHQLLLQQKLSTRVWRLKKYKNDDAELQSTLMQNGTTQDSSSTLDRDLDDQFSPTGKKTTRRVPARRPKIDKNGNPTEFVFVDASPQQQLNNQKHNQEALLPDPLMNEENIVSLKKLGKFPKNIFRLSTGNKKVSELSLKLPRLDRVLQTAVGASPSVSPTLKLSSSLQDLTLRARNPSISSPLKRTYTSLLQQQRILGNTTPEQQQQQQQQLDGIFNKPRSDSSTSMLCIKIDNNGRAAVIQQQQQQQQQQPSLIHTMSYSSSTSDLSFSKGSSTMLNSSRSRTPPLSFMDMNKTSSTPSTASSPRANAQTLLLPALGPSSNSAITTPYSFSATDDDDYEDNSIVMDRFISNHHHNHHHSHSQQHNQQTPTQEDEKPENDAIVAFTKLMGPKRKQMSRKSSTVSINSNFNNMTLTNGTPVSSSPSLARPPHQRSLSSMSTSSVRRHSPVRCNSRRSHHSQSFSISNQQITPILSSQSYDTTYYQSGINDNSNHNKVYPQQQIRQTIQQNIYHPLPSSTSLYNLNNNTDNLRHNSNDSSSIEYNKNSTVHVAPSSSSFQMSSSFTTGSISSLATPITPQGTVHDLQGHQSVPQMQQQQQQQQHQQQQQQQQQQSTINPYKMNSSSFLMSSAGMNKLNSMDSSQTLTGNDNYPNIYPVAKSPANIATNAAAAAATNTTATILEKTGYTVDEQLFSPYYPLPPPLQQQANADTGLLIDDDYGAVSLMYNDSMISNSSFHSDSRDEGFDLFHFINYENHGLMNNSFGSN